jgi:hypothetical protein
MATWEQSAPVSERSSGTVYSVARLRRANGSLRIVASLLAFLVCNEDGELQWTSRREGEDSVHDMMGILATVDVTLYENNPAYVRFIERFTGEDVPVDDDGFIDPNWVVDGDVLTERRRRCGNSMPR